MLFIFARCKKKKVLVLIYTLRYSCEEKVGALAALSSPNMYNLQEASQQRVAITDSVSICLLLRGVLFSHVVKAITHAIRVERTQHVPLLK